MNNSEACRLVGIDRKTGNRWRYGRRVRNSAGALVIYPPVKITESRPRSPRYLSEQERIRIADLLAAGITVRGVAVELGRAPSTISREIACNSDPDGCYRPHHAEQAARLRAARPRTRRIAGDGVLAETVRRLLAKRWSPEQVAHELRVLFDHPAGASAAPQATSTRLQRRGRLTAMRMIDERPSVADDRVQPGHWEGDLIMGAGNRSAIGTLVERTTRFLILLPFPDGATTEGVRDAITQAFESLPAGLRRTLTWDQGKELGMHQQITSAIGTGVFFCDAHSPWQRGSNENMNGLLRDYFPQGTDLAVHGVEELARIATEVNQRPRRTLGWHRPADLFTTELAVD